MHCLFSIYHFHRQNSIIIVAAVGDWWSVRVVNRSDFQNTFSRDQHLTADRDADSEDSEDFDLVNPQDTEKMKEMETLGDKRIR